jgi:hypothetical protein
MYSRKGYALEKDVDSLTQGYLDFLYCDFNGFAIKIN